MIDLKNLLTTRQANILGHEKYYKSAVILPVVEYKNEDCLLFEIRSDKLKFQPGEICFPGGGIEPLDNSPQEAAIRETCEELGLEETDIKVLGPLDILITPFQAIIYPFVARLINTNKININEDEVAEIFYVPVSFFLKNKPQTYYTDVLIKQRDDFPIHLLPNGKTYNWKSGSYPVHFYIYEDKIIWGITARIIHHFVQVING